MPLSFILCRQLPSSFTQAYQRCLGTVELYGPTNFGPIIKLIAQFSKEKQEAKDYFVLLIISDNCATDLIRTKQVRQTRQRYPRFLWPLYQIGGITPVCLCNCVCMCVCLSICQIVGLCASPSFFPSSLLCLFLSLSFSLSFSLSCKLYILPRPMVTH